MNDFEYLLNSEIGLVLFAINIMLFLVYGYDKFKSKINGWRVSEKISFESWTFWRWIWRNFGNVSF